MYIRTGVVHHDVHPSAAVFGEVGRQLIKVVGQEVGRAGVQHTRKRGRLVMMGGGGEKSEMAGGKEMREGYRGRAVDICG